MLMTLYGISRRNIRSWPIGNSLTSYLTFGNRIKMGPNKRSNICGW